MGLRTTDVSTVGIGAAPLAHKTSHADGGTDEIVLTDLSGVAADPQITNKIKTSAAVVTISSTAPTSGQALVATSPTNCAWSGVTVPVSTGVTGLGAGVASLLATPSSSSLAAALTDETGSGAAVFATSPTLVTPALGTPSALVLSNATGRASSAQTADQIKTAGTAVTISATAPTAGQALVASSSTACGWATVSGAAASQIATSGTAVTISSTAPTAGQTLVASSGTAVSWATPTFVPMAAVSISTNFTAVANTVYFVDCTSANRNVTMTPATAADAGKQIILKVVSGTGYVNVVSGGVPGGVITGWALYCCDGTSWIRLVFS
jgi:hypothetical protein